MSKDDDLSVTGRVSAFDSIPAMNVYTQEPTNYQVPVRLYEEQLLKTFLFGLGFYRANMDEDANIVRFPETNLTLFTLEDARFVISPGLDGLILDSLGRVIEEPSCFCNHDIYAHSGRLPDINLFDDLDEVFIGFDNAFRNYYHWMLYGISKTQIASDILSKNVSLVIPDVRESFDNRHPAFTRDVFEQSIVLSGLEGRVTPLADGIYRVRKLHFFWHNPKMPELYLNIKEVYDKLDSIVVPVMPGLPKKFYISRENARDRRMTAEDQAQIDLFLRSNGFETICLETMSLSEQISLFRQAEFIMAPHGAGLANLVFVRPGTKIIELNRQLDGQKYLRNCFYLIAQKRGAGYCTADLHVEKITSDKLQQAFVSLGS